MEQLQKLGCGPGTICKVLRKGGYHHYYMIVRKSKDQITVAHLCKRFIRIHCRVKQLRYNRINKTFFDFKRGVYVSNDDPLDEIGIKEMKNRLRLLISLNHIYYGLYSKNKFNCETLVSYIRTGEKTPSVEVLNYKKKFGVKGTCVVFCFDKIMCLVNKLGDIPGGVVKLKDLRNRFLAYFYDQELDYSDDFSSHFLFIPSPLLISRNKL